MVITISSSAIRSDRELALVARDLRAALVAVFLRDLLELALEERHPLLTRAEQRAEILDDGADLLELRLQLVDLEAGELGEAHVEDRLGLPLAQLEARLELRARDRRVGRG